MISDEGLIQKAKDNLNPVDLSRNSDAGGVASALVTDKGNVYVGVCIDTASSMGFCAEHNAIGTMITNKESRIETIVAVDWNGKILPPCGRCREFIFQVNEENLKTRVILPGKVWSLEDLLPEHWTKYQA